VKNTLIPNAARETLSGADKQLLRIYERWLFQQNPLTAAEIARVHDHVPLFLHQFLRDLHKRYGDVRDLPSWKRAAQIEDAE
jgi:hypothetical protein